MSSARFRLWQHKPWPKCAGKHLLVIVGPQQSLFKASRERTQSCTQQESKTRQRPDLEADICCSDWHTYVRTVL